MECRRKVAELRAELSPREKICSTGKGFVFGVVTVPGGIVGGVIIIDGQNFEIQGSRVGHHSMGMSKTYGPGPA